MKRKLVSGAFALALAVTAGYGVKQSMKPGINLSDWELKNVEALANGESDPGVRIYCRCSDGNILGFAKRCKANGENAPCAQSAQGGNIDCSTYNSNC